MSHRAACGQSVTGALRSSGPRVSLENDSPPPLAATEVRRRAVAGVASFVLREVVLRVLGLLGNLVLARLLVPRDYGALAFGFTLIALASLFADGGLGPKLIQRAESPTHAELRSLLGFTLMATAGAAIAAALAGLPLGRPGQLAAVMALSMPISALRAPTAVVAEREMLYTPIIRADIVQTLSYNVGAIALVALGFGVWGIAASLVTSVGLSALYLLIAGPLGLMWPSLRFAPLRPLLRFGLQFQGASAIGALRDQGINLVAAAVGGVYVLGIWSLAGRVLQGFTLILAPLWRVSFPAIARLIDSGEDPTPSVERALSLSSVMIGFAAIAVGGCAPALVIVAFGERWADVIPVLPWAAASLLVGGPISTAALGLLYARGEARTVLVAVVAHTVAWFAVAIPLIPQLGAQALAIGWCAGTVVDSALMMRALSRHDISILRHSLLPASAAGAAGALAWLIAGDIRPIGLALAVSLVAGEGVYAAAMVLFRRTVLRDIFGLLRRTARPRANAVTSP